MTNIVSKAKEMLVRLDYTFFLNYYGYLESLSMFRCVLGNLKVARKAKCKMDLGPLYRAVFSYPACHSVILPPIAEFLPSTRL